MSRFILTCLVLAIAAGTASAQSLADIARKERERRKHVKPATRVLTNDDLRPVAPGMAPAPSAEPGTESAAPADPAAPPADQAAQGAEPPAASEEEQREQDEQAWRQKMADARLALERSEMYLDALQSKINALWADFTARDDPAQRAQIEVQRQRALAEFERVKGEIEVRRKAIADLEEEARRANVPPGWLR